MFEKMLDWFEAAVTGNRLFAAIIFCALAVLLLVFIILACILARRARKLKKTLAAARRETSGNGVRKDEARKDAADDGAQKRYEISEYDAQENGDGAAEDWRTRESAAKDGAQKHYDYAGEEDAQEEVAEEDEWAKEERGQEYEFEITEDNYAEDCGEELYTDAEYADVQTPDGKAGNSLGAGSLKVKVKYDRPKCSWVILGEGSSRVLRRVKTKDEAIKVAKEICQKRRAALSLHKKDGKFQKHNFHIRNEKQKEGKKN